MEDALCGLRAYVKMTECDEAFDEWYLKDNNHHHWIQAKTWCALWKSHVEPLQKQNKLLRECVEFYARLDHINPDAFRDEDPLFEHGEKAQQCMEKVSKEK